MGPAAARAERLVHSCLRRARREREAAHGDAAPEADRDRRPMKSRSARDAAPASFRWRSLLLQGLLAISALALAWRAVNLQLVDHGFLAREGDARFSRVLEIAAHRGTITDRYGEPLAVSTPVDSVWVNPRELALATDQIPRLAAALKLDRQELARRVTSNLEREFLYLARHRQPAEAEQIKALGIPGVYTSREYRRYYPAGEVIGHLLGFTNVDDAGQEGLELAFDHWLAGEDGAKRVIQDRYGRIVQNVESIKPARPGRDLVLSIDLRIQYLAYRELKAAIRDQRARAGSAVVLDVASGEVLAMVNQPAYNPNDRDQIQSGVYRNRAATDIFEPGSSIKPFFVAAGLASGKYDNRSLIDTSPGFFKVGVKIFEDEHNYGAIDIATVLAKSSNVGMAHIALTLPPEEIWGTLNHLGFGQVSTSGYPGESAGLLPVYSQWRPIGIVTMSHGYGLSVTPLQLAHAYATIGAFGIARPVSFLRVEGAAPGERALGAQVCLELVGMLESVVAAEGTGKLAAIPGYRVSGKTGTAWKATAGGYSTDRYMAVFGGVAPASEPRLAAVVVIDEPGAGLHMGGQVAAPVFSRVIGGALRLLAVAPDQPVKAPEQLPAGTFVAAVPKLGERAGLIADRFFGAPSQQLTVAGITGTNGKTTCAWLLAQALQHCRRRCAYIGTLGVGMPAQLTPTLHTTSDAVSIHRQLAALRSLGAECVSMEVSSHALDQGRVNGVRFNTAAFTNLTRDHLDYHGTMEAYGAAKARLLALPGLAHRVINVDDPFGARLAEEGSTASLTVTTRTAAALPRGVQFVRAARVTPDPGGLIIEVQSSFGGAQLPLRLMGEFNVDNALTVLAVLLAWNIPLTEAARALSASRAASGRMEMFGGRGRTPLAIVDYAHTPDALANALRAARLHCRGQLRVVFGCGGERDAGKRPLMGKVAAELADDLIVTDDNPRSEDPARIVADIVAGVPPRAPLVIEHDRSLAIRMALQRSGPEDVVLNAGKGHEEYQIHGGVRRAFRDQAVVSAELARLPA